VKIDAAWERAVREAQQRGSVVYVLRNVLLLDLLALDALTRRLALPRIGFANHLGAWVEPWTASLWRRSDAQRLRDTIEGGGSAALFMKRPPSTFSQGTHRGRSDGDELLRVLLDLARSGRDIVMVPQTFVWTQRPERRGFSLVDTLFGPADFPGELRAAAQYVLNHDNCVLRAGEPLVLRQLLQSDDAVDVRRVTYALLAKLERERRAIVGPAQKPADRVREEVLRSPKLAATLRDMAGPGEAQRALLTDKARGMLRELSATPDPATLRGLEVAADTLVDRVYAGVDVDVEGMERVRAAARRGSVIFLPSHKSHVDYLLLSYVLRKHALSVPVVAAGDNLDFFPVGPLFRRAGAFFIRRNFKGDRLYTAVVDAYVRRLLRDGFAIEFFLEGGRSRTGKLLPPMLGLLNMLVDAALGLEGRTVSFVPVSIGYERMMEEGSYARELSGGEKHKEDAAALLKIGELLREKYGRANVQFGKVIDLDELRTSMGLGTDLLPAKRRSLVTRLAHQVMSEINRVTAVTPGSLVATVLLCHPGRGIAHLALVEQCARLARLVRRLGARTTPSLMRGAELREPSIRDAATVYVRGGLIRQHVPGDTLTGKARRRARIYTGDDVIYTVPDDQRLMLDLSKNMIVHLFADRALIAVALRSLLASGNEAQPLAALRDRVQSLSRLFKLEFMFRADAGFDRIFDEALNDMDASGELSRGADPGGSVAVGPGHDGLDGRGWLAFYAAVLTNFLESYRIAARAARVLLRGEMAEKDLLARALQIGEQMFLGGEVERSEAVSRPVIANAFAAFVQQGYLTRSAGKLSLAASFATEDAAQAIEAKVAGYLGS
jgi:glycerol-3-phosphate O-acyltransferase